MSRVRVKVRVRVRVRVKVTSPNPNPNPNPNLNPNPIPYPNPNPNPNPNPCHVGISPRPGRTVPRTGLLEKSAADSLGLLDWRMRADVFSVISAAEVPPICRGSALVEADCLGTNLVRQVRGGFRVGNFYSAKSFFSADSALEAMGGNWNHSDSGGLNRSPPRNFYATQITQLRITVINLIDPFNVIAFREKIEPSYM